jgi:hypothetical protein
MQDFPAGEDESDVVEVFTSGSFAVKLKKEC